MANRPPLIRIVAAVLTDGAGRTLLVRKRGTEAFMQPGGKRDEGEADRTALSREIQEELGCTLDPDCYRPLGCFRVEAANEPGCQVEAELFSAELRQPIRPGAEIAEAIWVDPSDCATLNLAPLTRAHAIPIAQRLIGGTLA